MSFASSFSVAILLLLAHAFRLSARSYAPLTSIQSAFMAGTCFLLDMRPRAGSVKRCRPSLASLDQCLSALRSMGKCFSYGLSTAEVLESLRQRWAPWDSPPPSNLPLAVTPPAPTFPSPSAPSFDVGIPSAGFQDPMYPFTLEEPWSAGHYGVVEQLFGVGEGDVGRPWSSGQEWNFGAPSEQQLPTLGSFDWTSWTGNV